MIKSPPTSKRQLDQHNAWTRTVQKADAGTTCAFCRKVRSTVAHVAKLIVRAGV
jgi:hypothetical protein